MYNVYDLITPEPEVAGSCVSRYFLTSHTLTCQRNSASRRYAVHKCPYHTRFDPNTLRCQNGTDHSLRQLFSSRLLRINLILSITKDGTPFVWHNRIGAIPLPMEGWKLHLGDYFMISLILIKIIIMII